MTAHSVYGGFSGKRNNLLLIDTSYEIKDSTTKSAIYTNLQKNIHFD
jgi:hypothetical protein